MDDITGQRSTSYHSPFKISQNICRCTVNIQTRLFTRSDGRRQHMTRFKHFNGNRYSFQITSAQNILSTVHLRSFSHKQSSSELGWHLNISGFKVILLFSNVTMTMKYLLASLMSRRLFQIRPDLSFLITTTSGRKLKLRPNKKCLGQELFKPSIAIKDVSC